MKYKLVCFDVDGTLVDNIEFSWEIFHEYFGINKTKREHAKKCFFEGTWDYQRWAAHDIQMWKAKGVTRQDFIEAMHNLKLMKGALETINVLKKTGIKLAIISGSLDIILDHLMPNYKTLFDDIFFSHLIFDEHDKLVKAHVTQYDMKAKADALRLVAKRENIPLSQCVHIGDHHNDVEIARIAGLSIAFDCKDERLRKIANVVIDTKNVALILPHIVSR